MIMDTNRVLTGLAISNSRASADVRVERLLRIKRGEIPIDQTTLSFSQLAALGGVSVHRLRKTAKNGNGNGAHKADPVEKQIRAFDILTPEQQVGFFRDLGRDRALELAVAAEQREAVPLVA